MWFLAPVAFVLSVIVFLNLSFTNKISFAAQLLAFLYSVFGWACAGLGIALFIIFVFSVYTQGAQTPFAFIFFLTVLLVLELELLLALPCGYQP